MQVPVVATLEHPGFRPLGSSIEPRGGAAVKPGVGQVRLSYGSDRTASICVVQQACGCLYLKEGLLLTKVCRLAASCTYCQCRQIVIECTTVSTTALCGTINLAAFGNMQKGQVPSNLMPCATPLCVNRSNLHNPHCENCSPQMTTSKYSSHSRFLSLPILPPSKKFMMTCV